MKISTFSMLILAVCIHCCVSLSPTNSLPRVHKKPISQKIPITINKAINIQAKLPTKSISQVLVIAKKAAFRGGINGFLAACFQVVTLMWLRTIINYQYRYGVSFLEAFSQLYSQGGVMRFYRGVTYAIIQAPISRFGVIASQEAVKVLLTHYNLTSPVLTSILITLASTLWRVLLIPLDTCKTILQVQGSSDFALFMGRVMNGELHLLYEGATATMAITFVSHYLLFYTQEFLELCIPKPGKGSPLVDILLRSASIGFMSSAVSDTGANLLRVIKTIKQTTLAGSSSSGDEMQFTYHGVKQLLSSSSTQQIRDAIRKGLQLATRGLSTRVAANGLQMVLFTVIWKLLQERSLRLLKARKEQKLKESLPPTTNNTIGGIESKEVKQPIVPLVVVESSRALIDEIDKGVL